MPTRQRRRYPMESCPATCSWHSWRATPSPRFAVARSGTARSTLRQGVKCGWWPCHHRAAAPAKTLCDRATSVPGVHDHHGVLGRRSSSPLRRCSPRWVISPLVATDSPGAVLVMAEGSNSSGAHPTAPRGARGGAAVNDARSSQVGMAVQTAVDARSATARTWLHIPPLSASVVGTVALQPPSPPSVPPSSNCNNSSVLDGPTVAPPGAVTVPVGDNTSLVASGGLDGVGQDLLLRHGHAHDRVAGHPWQQLDLHRGAGSGHRRRGHREPDVQPDGDGRHDRVPHD